MPYDNLDLPPDPRTAAALGGMVGGGTPFNPLIALLRGEPMPSAQGGSPPMYQDDMGGWAGAAGPRPPQMPTPEQLQEQAAWQAMQAQRGARPAAPAQGQPQQTFSGVDRLLEQQRKQKKR